MVAKEYDLILASSLDGLDEKLIRAAEGDRRIGRIETVARGDERAAGLSAALGRCQAEYVLVVQNGGAIDLKATLDDADKKGDFAAAVPEKALTYGSRGLTLFSSLGHATPDSLVLETAVNTGHYCAILYRPAVAILGGFQSCECPVSRLVEAARKIYPVSRLPVCMGFTPALETPQDASIPGPAYGQQPLSDTVYVVVHWGRANELRNQGTRWCLKWLTERQSHLPRILFLELSLGQGPQYADFADHPKIDYHLIEGDVSHGDLFQKEALYEYAVANLGKGEKAWIFADSDVIPMDPDYLLQYRNLILSSAPSMVQGVRTWRDQKSGGWQVSLGYAQEHRHGNDKAAPGLTWGTTRAYIDACRAKGRPFFNRQCFSGSGDCTLIFEHVRKACYRDMYARHFDFAWFLKVLDMQTLDKVPAVGLEQPLAHFHHGPFSDRAYDWSRRFLDAFGDVADWIDVDGRGLLRWRHEDNIVRRIVARKPDLKSREGTIRVACEEIARIMPVKDAGGGGKSTV